MGQSASGGSSSMSPGSPGQGNQPLNLSFGGGQSQGGDPNNANQNQNGAAGANGSNPSNNSPSTTPQGSDSPNNALANSGTAAGTSNWGRNRTSSSATSSGASAPDSQQMQPGLWRPGATSGTGQAGGVADSRVMGTSQANSTQMRSGGSQGGASASGGKTPSGSSLGQSGGSEDQSMTKQRRKNWGLRGATHAVAVSRPILLECYADHLTIVPDRPGSKPGKIVPLDSRTGDSVDELVSGIWEQIDTWGIAGNNMYWKPTLAIQVFPGGEQRYADLQALMADSGMDMKQRAAPAVPFQPPAPIPVAAPRQPPMTGPVALAPRQPPYAAPPQMPVPPPMTAAPRQPPLAAPQIAPPRQPVPYPFSYPKTQTPN